MKLLKIFNDEEVTPEEIKNFRHRRAVRAVLSDADGNIALLHAKNEDRFELPGGGVEEGETLEEGLLRECFEETGCKIRIVKEIGKTKEMRRGFDLLNESFGYTALVEGEKGEPEFTEDEIEEGMELIWLSLDSALLKMRENDISKSLYHEYVSLRDTLFLKEAKKLLED